MQVAANLAFHQKNLSWKRGVVHDGAEMPALIALTFCLDLLDLLASGTIKTRGNLLVGPLGVQLTAPFYFLH